MPSTSKNNRRVTNVFHDPVILEEDEYQEDGSIIVDPMKMYEFIQLNRDIDDFPLQQMVSESSQAFVDKFLATMSSIAEKWAYIGLNQNGVSSRLFQILSDFEQMCTEQLEIEEVMVQHLEKEKDEKLNELRNLTRDLDLPEYEPPHSTVLMKVLNSLLDKFKELAFIKDERVSKWKKYYSDYLELCERLGLPSDIQKPGSAIPTEKAIQNLQSTVLDFKTTYGKRQKVYIQNKRSILQLSDDLELDQNSADLIKYVGHEETSVILSEKFLKEQETFMMSLEKQCMSNEKYKDVLMDRLIQLWDKLEIDQQKRKQELTGIVSWKPSELKKLETIVDKYEEEKKKNMGKFIDKLRSEIVEFWDKVYASEEEREAFEIYLCEEDCTDALLTAHEDELDRLKMHYNENRKLFESLDEWQKCWVKYLDLEKKMNDPNRFNNRGGVLLKQEKEKKRTQKDLTRCEKDIRTLSDKWSQEHNNDPFLVCGQPVMEFIECQKTHYQAFKENEKKERQKCKSESESKAKKFQQANNKPTPNLLHRTPTKFSNTPASGVKSSEIHRLHTVTQPLSPVNRELRSLRTRLRVQRSGAENRCNSTRENSRRVTPGGGSIRNTPNIPTIVYGGSTKNIALDQLIAEEQFRAHLQDRKHETLESTSLSKKSRDNSPVYRTEYGALSRRKSRSYTILKLDVEEPLYKPTSPKLSRWGSVHSMKSNKSCVSSPRPPFRP